MKHWDQSHNIPLDIVVSSRDHFQTTYHRLFLFGWEEEEEGNTRQQQQKETSRNIEKYVTQCRSGCPQTHWTQERYYMTHSIYVQLLQPGPPLNHRTNVSV